jgi:hypothetical protein
MSDERAAVRAAVFRHLAGMAIATTTKALWDRRVFAPFDGQTEWVDFEDIAAHSRANRGYLRVALRLLVSSGWLKLRIEEHARRSLYSLTPEGHTALKVAPPLYAEVVPFISKAIFLEDFLFERSDGSILPSLQELVRRAKERWAVPASQDSTTARVYDQVRSHLDGIVIGPALVALGRAGVLEQLAQGPLEISGLRGNRASLACVFDLLAVQGWVTREKNAVGLTLNGQYAAQIASSYGVTVSYLPLFDNLSILLFGNPRIPRFDENGVETLVNRAMNVWGSGGAHKTYFKKVDEIIVEIFNRPPDQQPRGICDMGCGDGTLLEHLYRVVQNRTARGAMLDKHPLILVGADFNRVARRVSKQRLRQAAIPNCHVIAGDINRPAQLASDLEELGLDIHDLLHVRSFLDHNRPYSAPSNYIPGERKAKSTGAFAYLGDEIYADVLEENLVRHLRRWAPYVGRFGLIVLELHTLPPELTAANLEKTPAISYDGTHGYSDQYLVELPVFLDCAREAGLQADPRFQSAFPPSELATVSLNFFRAPATSQADPLLERQTAEVHR